MYSVMNALGNIYLDYGYSPYNRLKDHITSHFVLFEFE